MYYVYKLNCEDGVYVGMTGNLKARLWSHMHKPSEKGNHPYISYEIMVITKTKELALCSKEVEYNGS